LPFLNCEPWVALVFAVVIDVATTMSVSAQPPPTYDDVTSAEGWAWSRIKDGLPADFGEHCGVTLDPNAESDTWWQTDQCRTITAGFFN
jgi:hypothetical protein